MHVKEMCGGEREQKKERKSRGRDVDGKEQSMYCRTYQLI